MKRAIKLTYTAVIFLILTAIILSTLSSFGARTARAEVSAVQYTNVLDDLRKDVSFNEADYPAIDNDYSLNVIQIGESVNGELFIYVYQPCGQTQQFLATDINLSASKEVSDTTLYGLKLVNSSGTLYKYLVTDFTVKSEVVRYYNITSIYRKWYNGIDEPAGNDNTVNEVSFEVGQLWTAFTVGGNVIYEMAERDVITITDKYTGYIRYSNGFKLYKDSCDSHFIAFSTDYQIDNLMQAKVSYQIRTVGIVYMFGNETTRNNGEYIPQERTLSYEEIGGNRADGWWAEPVTYHRIERAKEFSESEDFDSETKTKLSKYQWVLRFLETDYQCSYSITAVTGENYSEVAEATVLTLTFETQGKTYTLGVVDNKQTGSKDPILETGSKVPFIEWLINVWNTIKNIPWWGWLLIVVGIIVAIGLVITIIKLGIVAVFKAIFWLIGKLLQGLWWLVSLPFRLIAGAITERKKSK